MEKIDKSIEDFLKKIPVEKLKEAKAFKVSKEYIRENYGEDVKVAGVMERVLFLKIFSSILRSEIEFKKKDILSQINRRIGENFFIDLKFKR